MSGSKGKTGRCAQKVRFSDINGLGGSSSILTPCFQKSASGSSVVPVVPLFFSSPSLRSRRRNILSLERLWNHGVRMELGT